MDADLLRQLPSVSDLLQQTQDLVLTEGHQRVVDALRDALSLVRQQVRAGADVPANESIIQMARQALQQAAVTDNVSVINATGVIIHTNLGRAVLSRAAQEALATVARGYSPVEYNLVDGQRGRRGAGVEDLLCQVTGAEAALVVNNCAAATVLMLTALVHSRAVVISRGQLVEIGGGFRIPEIMSQSGAKLIEVGTTNRTRLSDYEKALQTNADVAALMRVHASNFKMLGFTTSVDIAELVELAKRSQPPVDVLDDLGSGALLDTASYGLSHEPMPQESLRAGATVAVFSADKLLGGPQAGIMVGTREAIGRCRAHPLARALRADKYTLAALGATVPHYLRGEAEREIPIWRMIAMPKDEIRRRAECCQRALQGWADHNALRMELIDGESTIGGGSLPGEVLPTVLIALRGDSPDQLAADLRKAPVPVIARIRDDCVLLDLRTVLDDQQMIDSVGRR